MNCSGDAIDRCENSYLRPWVQRLPLRYQGALLVATRGCDLTPKYPLDSWERQLVAAIRFAVGFPADPREVDSEIGCFMQSSPPMDMKVSAFGHYPHHWVVHVMHACEIIGYRHPDVAVRGLWTELYTRFCTSLHVNPEQPDQLETRMTEDRIASGTVVS